MPQTEDERRGDVGYRWVPEAGRDRTVDLEGGVGRTSTGEKS